MDPLLVGVFVCVIALLFLLSGMPIAFALGGSALVISLIFGDDNPFNMLAQLSFDSLDSFALLAIPLFVFMGNCIANSPAGNDLYDTLHRWLHKLPGGLVISNIVACAVFAAMCGSSPATAAAIGTTGVPEMIKRGNSPALSTGAIVGGGTLGILIPPSVTMIIYGIATESSIGRLFIAGILPGLMIMLMFSGWACVCSIRDARKRVQQGFAPPAEEKISLREKMANLPRVIPFLLIIAAIMFSLYGGVATPSESAAVGALTALVLVVAIYRIFSLKVFGDILRHTIRETTMICFILIGSALFGNALSKLYITQAIANMIVNMEVSRWILMIVINIFLLILGCFIPPVAIILIAAPILHPIITGLGFDTIWFGIIMTLNMEAGLITPPMGVNLYVVQGVAPDVPLSEILKGSIPFILILLVGIIILCVFPQIATWLPTKMIGA